MVVYNIRQEALAVANASIPAMEEKHPNTPRTVMYFRNTSTNADEVITLSFNNRNPAVANVGIVLKQNEMYVETTSEGFECWQGAINVICAVAGPAQLTILER